jgi:hypothetical protein
MPGSEDFGLKILGGKMDKEKKNIDVKGGKKTRAGGRFDYYYGEIYWDGMGWDGMEFIG